MTRKYRKERNQKSKSRIHRPIEVQQYLDSLSPTELWEACKPMPIFLAKLTPEEQLREIQDSRIVVFELLAKRFGLGLLELHGDIIHPLELKLDYSIPRQLDPILEPCL